MESQLDKQDRLNIFAIRDKKPLLFQLRACEQETQSVLQSLYN